MAGIVVATMAACTAAAAGPKRVLVLDSFERQVTPYSVVASAFRNTLVRELGQPVDIYEASLDMARFADPGFEKPFVDFLAQRFADRPLDLVVPVGAPASRFAAQYRETLFANTPILYAGVAPRLLSTESLSTNATLVTQQVDLPGIMEDVLKVQPETTNVVVVLGASPLERYWVRECRREWAGFTNRLGFAWLDTLTHRQMREAVTRLPPRSFIVFVMMVVDAEGVPYDGDEVLKDLRAVANAPIFSYYRSQFGLGVIGGRLYQDSDVGVRAGKVAIRILCGERAGDIPPEVLGISAPVYDWRELSRWGISPDRLPAGSRIEYRQPTLWAQYRWHLAGVAGFCCLQTALVIGLVVNRAKRREEAAIATLIADLSSKFIHIPAGDVDREIADAQRSVCEGLKLDISALWQWPFSGPDVVTMTHLYRPSGGPPIPEPMNARDYFPWCLRQLQEGKTVSVRSLQDLPLEAARDREVWDYFGIKSNLTFPLSAGGGHIVGALGFNTTGEERAWSEEVVKRLRVVAQIFANALARKRAEQELRESEERLGLAAEAAGAGLWSLDLATSRFWLTKKTRELFDLPADQSITLEQFLEIVHTDDRERIRQTVRKVLDSKGEVQVEYRVLRPDGRVQWVFSRGRVHCNSSGQAEYLMGVSLDYTARKQAEEALRNFSARFIRAQEQDRARLARELHDDITQRLACLAIDVGRLEAGTAAESRDETGRSVREELIRLSEDVHALSYRLHPSILEDLGLAAAVRAEAERFERQGSVPISVRVGEIPDAVPPEAALCVFRVAQEAVRNATRHADPRTIKLTLSASDSGLQLAVQDDGCGFDVTLQRERPSLGLASMRERVHLLNGELDIESVPGCGTTVLAWVPLKAKEL